MKLMLNFRTITDIQSHQNLFQIILKKNSLLELNIVNDSFYKQCLPSMNTLNELFKKQQKVF